MTSTDEQRCSRALRAIPAELPSGASFAELQTKEYRKFLSGLDWFISDVLAEIHPEWMNQKTMTSRAMDGIVPLVARKTGDREAELFGICYLLVNEARSHATAPLHVRLQIAPNAEEITWFECRLGERGKDGLEEPPYNALAVFPKRYYLLDGKYEQLDWFYEVTFGERTR
jgi:hypothetical protein